jgi:asparagine synthase (glutamine-hydrolysing)
MANRIPERVVKRPKQPYRAPISSVFISADAPEYVGDMLSDENTKKVGIFNMETLQPLLNKIEKTGTASEMDNMVLAAVLSTHLLHRQFIENKNDEFHTPELKNLKIIEDF